MSNLYFKKFKTAKVVQYFWELLIYAKCEEPHKENLIVHIWWVDDVFSLVSVSI